MEMTKDGESTIVFYYKKTCYSGTLVYSPGKYIRVIFYANTLFSRSFMNTIEIGDLRGALANPSRSILLCNCVLHSTSFGSNGIVAYEIKCTYAYVGDNLKNIKATKIRRYSIYFNGLENWIGNQLIDISTTDYKKQFDYRVNMSRSLESIIDEKSKLSICSNATVPLGPQEDGKYIIAQKTFFCIEGNSYYGIEDIINDATYLKNLFTFILRYSIGINEISFTKKRKFGTKYISQKIDIIVGFRKNETNRKNSEPWLKFDLFCKNPGKYFALWKNLEQKHEYLSQFVRYYFDNQFVDQRLISLISLLETMHNGYFSGIKRTKRDYDAYLDEIRLCLPKKYKDEVIGILSDKNSISLKAKLANYSKYAQDEEEYLSDAPKYVRFRNNSAHGSGGDEFTIDDLIRMEARLYRVVCKFILDKALSIEHAQ